ncbi:MAG TPA: nucleotidyltransferase domain-containing protein [Chloroflexota bacterium]
MAVPEKRVALLEARRAVAGRVDHVFADHPEVSSVLVFGSVASGEVDEHSDVDLLVIS